MLDLTGQRFGRLTVLSEATRRARARYWTCKCDCGSVTVVYQGDLRRKPSSGAPSRSCGCLRKEMLIDYHTKHGQCGTSAYKKWKSMHRRIRESHLHKNACYVGLTVCKRWRNFANFLADMGEPPIGMTLERRDNYKGYSKENCRWATWKEQMNNHSGVLKITFKGRTQSMKAWADETGIKYSTLAARIGNGWSAEKALTVAPRRSP